MLMIDNVWLRGVVGLRCLFLVLRKDIYQASSLDELGWLNLLNEREGLEEYGRPRKGKMRSIINCLVYYIL